MGFDIRTPIGLMFSLFGLLVSGYGLATRGSLMYEAHSLGINVNFGWGLVMLAFGAAMLLLSRSKAASRASGAPSEGDLGDSSRNAH